MTRGAWIVLAIFWVIASFPVAVLIGQWISRSNGGIEALIDATREPPPVSDQHADRLLRLLEDDSQDTSR